MPAHFRWGAGFPGQKQLLHRENAANDVDEEVYGNDGAERHEAQEASAGDRRAIADADEAGQLDISGEAKTARTLRTPEPPTDAARMAHNATHVPFRGWCPICVASRGRSSPHRRVVVNKTADTLPKFQTDYMFIRKVAESKTQPCITFVETRSGLVISFMCSRKGGYEDLTKEILRHLDAYGFLNPIIIQCDKEMSIIDVCRKVARERNARTVWRFAPKTSHQSNWFVEAVQGHIQGLARCYQTQIETNTGIQLSAISLAIPFAIRYAGFVLSRFTVRPDGRTQFPYLLGTPYVSLSCMFGESVIALIPNHEVRAAKLTNRWISGCWWGRDASSDEHLVGMKHGLLKCRSVRRKAPGERWSRRATVEARGTKWNFDVEMDSGIPGPQVTSRPDEEMSTATAPLEIRTVPPPAPPPEEHVPEIQGHRISGGGDVAAKTGMVICDPSTRILRKRGWLARSSVTQTFLEHLFQTCWTRTTNWSILDRSSLHWNYRNARTTSTWWWCRGALCHFQGQVHHYREHRHSDKCNLPGIRVPKCTRWRSQRIHNETYCQVRGRMLGHCSNAECKGSDDAFDGTEELESARWDDSAIMFNLHCSELLLENYSIWPEWDRIWCLRQNACHTNVHHQHLQIWHVPRKYWDIWKEHVNWISTWRYLHWNRMTWTIFWNTSRDILTLTGLVTQWRGKAHLALCVTLINFSRTMWMSRTGDCCFVQWRIRTESSWCTVSWVVFRTSCPERDWTVTPDTRESRQQYSTRSGNETRSKSQDETHSHEIVIHSRLGISENSDDVIRQDWCESEWHRDESAGTRTIPQIEIDARNGNRGDWDELTWQMVERRQVTVTIRVIGYGCGGLDESNHSHAWASVDFWRFSQWLLFASCSLVSTSSRALEVRRATDRPTPPFNCCAASCLPVRGSLQPKTTSEGRKTMCQGVKRASLGDAWDVLVNALSSCGVSMTRVAINELACSFVGVPSFEPWTRCDVLLLQSVLRPSLPGMLVLEAQLTMRVGKTQQRGVFVHRIHTHSVHDVHAV